MNRVHQWECPSQTRGGACDCGVAGSPARPADRHTGPGTGTFDPSGLDEFHPDTTWNPAHLPQQDPFDFTAIHDHVWEDTE